jgi:hypothetical protein
VAELVQCQTSRFLLLRSNANVVTVFAETPPRKGKHRFANRLQDENKTEDDI